MEMIKKLRYRFVAITMVIVTLMLIVIFGLVLTLTHRRIYSDSVQMLKGASVAPLGMNQNRRPERHDRSQTTDVQLPFFRVEVDADGNIIATDGDFFDLTDEDTISELVNNVLSRDARIGDLSDYTLRYYRSSAPVFRDFEKDPGAQDPGAGAQFPAPNESPAVDVNGKALTNGDIETQGHTVGTSETDKALAPEGNGAPNGEADPQIESGERLENRNGNDFADPEEQNEKWDGKSNRIIVFADISSEVATMNNLIRNCVLIGILSFLVFLVIAIFFARWAVKPVEDAWIQQRQFVSDASHELKTPLTVILTDAEMLKSRDFDDEKKKQFASNIYTMSIQMRGLVESLLQLARVDNGAIQKVPMQLVDLSQMVSNEVLTFEVLFFEKGLTLSEDVQKDIIVKGSEQHIKQVIEILLDNAQKYSDSNGTVNVVLEKVGSHKCVLSVSDPGDPISEENLKNIFKRFYRIDEARAMNHSYGLGLSIAQNIVLNHKGKIWAESKDGINSFKVELPLA